MLAGSFKQTRIGGGHQALQWKSDLTLALGVNVIKHFMLIVAYFLKILTKVVYTVAQLHQKSFITMASGVNVIKHFKPFFMPKLAYIIKILTEVTLTVAQLRRKKSVITSTSGRNRRRRNSSDIFAPPTLPASAELATTTSTTEVSDVPPVCDGRKGEAACRKEPVTPGRINRRPVTGRPFRAGPSEPGLNTTSLLSHI